MRGHRQIIDLRRQGLRPASVFVDLLDQATPVQGRYDEPENSIRLGLYPHVEVLRSDVHGPLDMRFLVGLTVHVAGAEMDDDMGKLLDLVAEHAGHVVGCAGDVLIEFHEGNWQAWKF